MDNPFRYDCVVSGDHFCERTKELQVRGRPIVKQMRGRSMRLDDNNEALRQSLIRIANGLSDINSSLQDGERDVCSNVVSTLTRSVIPQLSSDCPLLVAVTGGGSTGKSTLFNFLAGAKVSASDPTAGYTRRMVAAIHPKVVADKQKMELLFERFRANARPRALSKPEDALEPGDPVYVECPNVPEHLVLVDTPDFNVGMKEGFTNRNAAKEILEVVDVVLYVATNTTYNNKSDTDFVRSILSEIGVRKVALLYRFSPVYDDDIVRKHMAVALSNLYPDERTAKEACIGIWRIDESNEVAAGKRDPEIRPVDEGVPLAEVLAALDPTKTRANVMRGVIDDSLRHADTWVQDFEIEALKYVAYRDSLKFLTIAASDGCLRETPQRDIIKLFVEEWEKAQPWFVRNGHWLSRTTLKATRKVIGVFHKDQGPSNGAEPSFAESFRTEFLKSVQKLQRDRESPCARFDFPKKYPDLQYAVKALRMLAKRFPDDYSIDDVDSQRKDGNYTAKVSRPAALDAVDGLSQPVGELLESMGEQVLEIVGETESFRPDVKELVRSFREKMTKWQSVKEWSSASLDTIAIVGTLSYVAVTGDAFTGGTLMSMFGLNDLVVIPALSAFIAANCNIDKKIVDKQTSGPLTAWRNGKRAKILEILTSKISGRDIEACDKMVKRFEGALGELKPALADAHKQAGVVFGN